MNEYYYYEAEVKNKYYLLSFINVLYDNYIDNFISTFKNTIKHIKNDITDCTQDLDKFTRENESKDYHTSVKDFLMNIYTLFSKIKTLLNDENENYDVIIHNLNEWSLLLRNICSLLYIKKDNYSIIYLNELIEYSSIFDNISKIITNIKNKKELSHSFYMKLYNDKQQFVVKEKHNLNSDLESNNDKIIIKVFPKIADFIKDKNLQNFFDDIHSNPDKKDNIKTTIMQRICEILIRKYMQPQSPAKKYNNYLISKINLLNTTLFKENVTIVLNKINEGTSKDDPIITEENKNLFISVLDNILTILSNHEILNTNNAHITYKQLDTYAKFAHYITVIYYYYYINGPIKKDTNNMNIIINIYHIRILFNVINYIKTSNLQDFDIKDKYLMDNSNDFDNYEQNNLKPYLSFTIQELLDIIKSLKILPIQIQNSPPPPPKQVPAPAEAKKNYLIEVIKEKNLIFKMNLFESFYIIKAHMYGKLISNVIIDENSNLLISIFDKIQISTLNNGDIELYIMYVDYIILYLIFIKDDAYLKDNLNMYELDLFKISKINYEFIKFLSYFILINNDNTNFNIITEDITDDAITKYVNDMKIKHNIDNIDKISDYIKTTKIPNINIEVPHTIEQINEHNKIHIISDINDVLLLTNNYANNNILIIKYGAGGSCLPCMFIDIPFDFLAKNNTNVNYRFCKITWKKNNPSNNELVSANILQSDDIIKDTRISFPMIKIYMNNKIYSISILKEEHHIYDIIEKLINLLDNFSSIKDLEFENAGSAAAVPEAAVPVAASAVPVAVASAVPEAAVPVAASAVAAAVASEYIPNKIHEITTMQNFNKIINLVPIVLIKISEIGCGPCGKLLTKLVPIIENNTNNNIIYASIINDDNLDDRLKKHIERLSISSYPHSLIYYRRELVDSIQGADIDSITTIIAALNAKLSNNPIDGTIEEQKNETINFQDANELFRHIIVIFENYKKTIETSFTTLSPILNIMLQNYIYILKCCIDIYINTSNYDIAKFNKLLNDLCIHDNNIYIFKLLNIILYFNDKFDCLKLGIEIIDLLNIWINFVKNGNITPYKKLKIIELDFTDKKTFLNNYDTDYFSMVDLLEIYINESNKLNKTGNYIDNANEDNLIEQNIIQNIITNKHIFNITYIENDTINNLIDYIYTYIDNYVLKYIDGNYQGSNYHQKIDITNIYISNIYFLMVV